MGAPKLQTPQALRLAQDAAKTMQSAVDPDQGALQDAIVFIHRTSIRPLVRQELKDARVASIHIADSLDACAELLGQFPRAMLVIDWDHGPIVVNQALRAAQTLHRIDTRPILLIASEVSLEVVAIGTEYNVSRAHTGDISRDALHEHISHIVDEEADHGLLRSALLNVAEARGQGHWTSAGRQLRELAARWPDNRRIACELIDNYIHEERWDDAYKELDQLSIKDRHNLRVQHLKARCLMRQGHFEQAAELLKQTQLINPYNVDRLLDLGKALMQIGSIKEALGNFEQVLSLASEHDEARRGQWECRLMTGDVNHALQMLRELSGPRELASVFNNAAILSIRHGNFDQGISLYRTAIGAVGAEAKLKARLIFNLGIAFHKCGRLEDALTCFEEAAATEPTHSRAKHNASAIAGKLGRRSTADGSLNKILSISDDLGEIIEDETFR